MGYVGMLPHRRNRCCCYSSKDLLNWKFEGIVLPAVKDDEKHDLHPSKVLERPKVIYNEKTKEIRHVGACGKC